LRGDFGEGGGLFFLKGELVGIIGGGLGFGGCWGWVETRRAFPALRNRPRGNRGERAVDGKQVEGGARTERD